MLSSTHMTIIFFFSFPQADPRFLWNSFMLEVLVDNKVRLLNYNQSTFFPGFLFKILWYGAIILQLEPYLLPVMQGNILLNMPAFLQLILKLDQHHHKFVYHVKLSLNQSERFQSFQSAIGKDIIDVTLVARRCNRRTGKPQFCISWFIWGKVPFFLDAFPILLLLIYYFC